MRSPGAGGLRNLQEEGLGAFETLERRRNRGPRLADDVSHGVDVRKPLLKLVERPHEATDELGLADELGSGPPAPAAMLVMLSRFRLELIDRPPMRVGRGEKLLLGAGVEAENETEGRRRRVNRHVAPLDYFGFAGTLGAISIIRRRTIALARDKKKSMNASRIGLLVVAMLVAGLVQPTGGEARSSRRLPGLHCTCVTGSGVATAVKVTVSFQIRLVQVLP